MLLRGVKVMVHSCCPRPEKQVGNKHLEHLHALICMHMLQMTKRPRMQHLSTESMFGQNDLLSQLCNEAYCVADHVEQLDAEENGWDMDDIPLEDEMQEELVATPAAAKPALSRPSPQKLTGDAQLQNRIALLERVSWCIALPLRSQIPTYGCASAIASEIQLLNFCENVC